MNKRENLKIFRSSIGKLLDEKGVSYSFIQNENFNFRELKIGLVSGFKGRSVTIGIAEKMIQKLANQLVENEISYYILDCDYTSDKTLLELFSLTNWGDFESCWIEHGEIIKKYNLKPELQTFLQFMDLS